MSSNDEGQSTVYFFTDMISFTSWDWDRNLTVTSYISNEFVN